jgi:hypothetical protein
MRGSGAASRPPSTWRARWVAASLVVGVVTGLGAFALTAHHQQYGHLGPLCRSYQIRSEGFDPWTGDPVGEIYVCDPTYPNDPPSHHVTVPPPPELVGRRAIPVPSGFAVGSVATAVLLWVRRRRVTFGDAD